MPTIDTSQKQADLQELRKYLGEEQSQAESLLEDAEYDLLAAMELLASKHGVLELSDSDWETCLPNDVADVSHAMFASSYGRVVKVMKRIETLATATTVQLPQIVVIGSESSGKSSTLERIAGFSLFPRDSKICTRMPIMLRLINVSNINQPGATDEQATVLLKFPGRNDVIVSEADAADAVGALMASIVPPGRGVIHEQLTIEVRKASVPTLDLIDLPGIVAASIEGEPADMMSRTRNITERYLRGANTIVVAVVPANITRVRDSQAMQLVQVNGKQEVTLGVLAKSDLAHDPRFKQHKKSSPYWELQQRLAGEADDMIPLPNGWVAVKNRDTQIEEEEAGGPAESLQAEREWFAKETNISAEIQKEQCGIDALLRNINGLFTKHMRATWVPRAIKHLEQEMASVTKQILELGPLPATLTLQQVLAEFTSNFNSMQVTACLTKSIHQTISRAVSAATESVAQRQESFASTPPTTSHARHTRVANRREPHAVAATVSLLQLLSKDETEAAIIKVVSSPECMSTCKTEVVGSAVRRAFELPGLLRLKRFELLPDVIMEMSRALIHDKTAALALAVQAAVNDHFAAFLGCPYDRNGSSHRFEDTFFSTSHRCDTSFPNSSEAVLIHKLSEVALRTLVLPLQLHSPKLLETLSKFLSTSGAASSIFSSEKPPCLSDPDAAAELLVESCKEQRARLAKRRYDLFRSLKEVQKL